MIHITSGLGLVLEVGLAVFCFVDVLMQPEGRVKYVPRWVWAVAILVFPVAGCVAYLVFSRGARAAERAASRRTATTPDDAGDTLQAPGTATAVRADKRTASRLPHPSTLGPLHHPEGAPDDGTDLILELSRLNDEHEAMLRRWEEDLRAREERLRAAALPDADLSDAGSPLDRRDDVAA